MLFEPIHRDFRDKNDVNVTSSEGAVADNRLGRARFLPHESAVALGPAWEQPAFTVKDRTFSVREVIEAAHFRGGLDAWWHKAARIVESELTVDTEAVQVRADEFRTARDLITAEETERWLAVRGLTMEEFGDYCLAGHPLRPRCREARAADGVGRRGAAGSVARRSAHERGI